MAHRKPCRHEEHVPTCHFCRLFAHNPRYRELWKGRDSGKPKISIAQMAEQKRH